MKILLLFTIAIFLCVIGVMDLIVPFPLSGTLSKIATLELVVGYLCLERAIHFAKEQKDV